LLKLSLKDIEFLTAATTVSGGLSWVFKVFLAELNTCSISILLHFPKKLGGFFFDFLKSWWNKI